MAAGIAKKEKRATPLWFEVVFGRVRPLWASALGLAFCLLILAIYISPMLENFGNMQADMDWYGFGAMYESFRAAVVHHHQFPLRTDMLEGGYPMVGFPYDISLSPFALLILAFGSTPGMKLMMITAFFLGGCGFFFLMRKSLQANLAASVFGTVFFLLSAWMPMQVDNANVPLLMAPYLAVWPIAFLILAGEDFRWVIPGAAGMYLIVTLTPQSAIPLSIFLFFVAAAKSWPGKDPKRFYLPTWRAFAALGLMAVLSVFFCAPKLLPVWDLQKRFVGHVHMENESDYATVAAHIRDDNGGPSPDELLYSITHPNGRSPKEQVDIYSLYAGWLPLLLAVLGIFPAWRKSLWAGVVFGLTILYLLGPYSPVNLHKVGWYLFPPTQFIWKLNKYYSAYAAICIGLSGGLFFEYFKGKGRFAKIIGPVTVALLVLAVADPMTNNRRLFADLYQKPFPAQSELAREDYAQLVVEGIPEHRYNDISSIREKERYFSQYAYLGMFKNIGTINWPTNMRLYNGAVVPKYLVPSYETPDYDALDESKWKLNPDYRGEAYFEEGSPNSVTIEKWSPNEMIFSLEIERVDQPLIINQNFHEFFQVSTGRIANLDGALGVRLPQKGQHQLRVFFLYWPLRVGLYFACVAIAAVIFILRHYRIKRVLVEWEESD